MEQLDFFDIPNPCVGVCYSNEKGYCQGCMRNREERFNWQNKSVSQKLDIWRLCRQRAYRNMLESRKKEANLAENEEAILGEIIQQGNLF